ncbi:aminoglycoside phosphotransferase family protein [Anabaena subtropica]|uniref:Aminoglycoside phosphotransferase family protein n=1 Tax=Anabaena subtropica FACHB-260 TaxID=2692884 RepID=A0ABR8CUJ9_9NOST|nr:aminoglycoside phosphotransferase family protein [Anabaena subtropica]MBD2345897.1 aminoglycoside phosphotransferase family protein [Anabaena subtropica FACHB-260]
MPPFILSSQNVFEYLISLNLCTSDEQSLSKIELKPAKNFNLLVTFPDGRKLLVKQERHNLEGKTTGEFLLEWRIHDFVRKFPELSHIRSRLSEAVQFNWENSIIIFNYLDNYRDLMDFYAKENLNLFPIQLAKAVGNTLALIHRTSFNSEKYREFFQNPSDTTLNPTTPNLNRGLERLAPEIFGKVPADGLRFFALYQRYDSLGQAIAQLLNSFTPCCLTHNDLKLNNILLSLNWEDADDENIVRLIDWERGNWGDPANDLGTVIASYLQIWLYSMVTGKSIALEESLRLAATPLYVLQPSMRELVTAYLTNFPEILEHRPDFLQRVMQFCGLALVTAIQAQLQYEKTFGNAGICMLQVAKSLLCRPEASIPTILGVQLSDISPASLSQR